MEKSEKINELATALAKAQGEFSPVPKTGVNPYFKSRYATLDGIIAAVKGPLSENDIAYTQLVGSNENGHTLTTALIHTSGQWISSTSHISIPVEQRGRNEMQAFGSDLTYMKRYALAAILGVASDEDDDGNASSKPPVKAELKEPPRVQDELQDHQGATMEQLWARWSELWGEAEELNIKHLIEVPPADIERDELIERGLALVTAVEAARSKRLVWPATIIAAVLSAKLSQNPYSVKNALKHSVLYPETDKDVVVRWFQEYRAQRNSGDSVEEAAAIANAQA